MISQTAVQTMPAWMTKTIIDDTVIHGNTRTLFFAVAGLFIATAASRGLQSAQTYCTEWLGQSVVHDLRNDLYGHLQSQSMSFYDQNQTGQLMSRVTSDVGQIQFFVSNGIIRIMDSASSIAIYLVLLFTLDKIGRA